MPIGDLLVIVSSLLASLLSRALSCSKLVVDRHVHRLESSHPILPCENYILNDKSETTTSQHNKTSLIQDSLGVQQVAIGSES